jgi:hypothetical protein
MSADVGCRAVVQARTWHCAGLVLPILLLWPAHSYAQSEPRPPCGTVVPVPAYAGLDDPATVKAWSKADFGRDWKPPACTGWTTPGFSTLITTTTRFQSPRSTEDLLRHIGAISKLGGVRYWSTTKKQWKTLIVEAHALTGWPSGQRRDDFAPDEMKAGKQLYFEQTDNLSGKATYRMNIGESSANRLVFYVENVSTLRYLFVTLFQSGEVQSAYFLDRESERVWRYYSMVRTGKDANRLTSKNDASAVTRSTALYRHFAGIPTDKEPPSWR